MRQTAWVIAVGIVISAAACCLNDMQTLTPASTRLGIPSSAVSVTRRILSRSHPGDIDAVFSPDGRYVAVGLSDGVYLFHVGAFDMVWVNPTGGVRVRSVAFSPDGTALVGGLEDSTVVLWDARTGEHLWTSKGHSSIVRSVDFSPDVKTIASG